MVGESIPQTGSGGAEGAVSDGSKPGPRGLEEVGLSSAEMPCGGMGGEQFFEVEWGITMEALVGQQGDFIFNPEWDRKPVEGFEDGCDVVVLSHSHQDPRSTVLNVLQLLDVLVGDPDERCIAVVQPGGDKGVDKLFGI